MIFKQDFYFIRHGQTDHNLLPREVRGDHPPETPLNHTGVGQAKAVEPIIANLPIRTICASPMTRAQQTKEIISARLSAPHHEIEELGECCSETWQEMRALGMYAKIPSQGKAALFVEKVRKGVNEALAKPGPTLIVAHGGVHWALCCLMGIQEHDWATDNCVPIHFVFKGRWIAKKLTK